MHHLRGEAMQYRQLGLLSEFDISMHHLRGEAIQYRQLGLLSEFDEILFRDRLLSPSVLVSKILTSWV